MENTPKRPLVSEIITKASLLSNISLKEIRSSSRKRENCHVRSAIIWVARQYVVKDGAQDRFSYPNLARMLGKEDHTTIIHAHNMFDEYCQINPELLAFAEKLKMYVEKDFSELHEELERMRSELREIEEARMSAEAERKARIAYEATLRAEQQEALRLQRIAKNKEERERAKAERMRLKKKAQERKRRERIPEFDGLDKNNFLPEENDEIDGSHEMMLDMAEGSRKLLAAIIREHRNVYNPSKSPSIASNLIG